MARRIDEMVATDFSVTRTGPTLMTHPTWDDLYARIAQWSPRTHLGQIVRACFAHLPPDLAGELLDAITRSVVLESELEIAVLRPLGNGSVWREYYGVVSRKVITTAGVGYLVDAWQNSVELENQRYHALGTGTNAENASDTALQTELSTEYTGNQRAQGTLTENAANIFETVGTNTLDSGTPAVTEHGILSQQATGGGTLWDRSVFSAINLNGANGDGLQSTYRMTASSGG